ncbi:MFS transporter [Salsuginibacillus halophilus]|uniref:MFS transporter n=1 Tax=Salsuginibacillus halophilus TaxID=517424 RepID=A0A2P8HEC4_9BACI|nr:MFS transporter [Salsuginibacillus halophilus]PSL44511.1 MFS transporter [Salsuginibacillus halophilus]
MPKILWLIILGMAVNVTAVSFLWPMNTIFIHQELGQPLAAAGIVLMFNAGAGVIGNLIGGRLFDRIGGYWTILLGLGIALISAVLLAFFHSYYQYIAFLAGIGFGGGMTFPAFYAMAGNVWPEGGRRPFNAIYVAQNVGVASGTAMAGVVASIEMDYIFFANALSYVLLILFAAAAYKGVEVKRSSAGTGGLQEAAGSQKYRLKALFILCGGFIICWIAYVQWQSNVSVHIQSLGIPLSSYSVLWTINGAMIVLMQPIMAFVVRRWVTSLKGQLYTGVTIFVISFAVLSQAEVFAGFLAAMIILTIGELFVWPAVPTVAYRLAPPGKEGSYQGLVNSVATGGRMIGPLFGGVIVDAFGMGVLFYVLLATFGIAFLCVALFDRPLKRHGETVERDAEQAA